jgi:hypothetical protein
VLDERFDNLRVAEPHFSRPVKKCAQSAEFVGVSRESFRPGNPHPKRLAAGDFFTNRRICEKVRLTFLSGWRNAGMPLG